MALFLGLGGCQGGMSVDNLFPKAERPLPADLVKTMKAKGMTSASPIMVRIFKKENVLEVWKQADTGRYELLKEYEICKWSGKLGPKFKEGDRQAPEGFYTVNEWQMNPKSQYYLSFNIGFPNAFDRAHQRTGTHLMVHGACSSAGCYSMTDERMGEIFALAREAFEGGQKAFQVQAFPFRMSPQNMAEHKDHPHFEFWKMLKEGYDHFEITKAPPKVDVCEKKYVFNRIPEGEQPFRAAEACPQMSVPDSLALAYSKHVSKEEEVFQKALKTKAIREAWAGRKPEKEEPAVQEAPQQAAATPQPDSQASTETAPAQGAVTTTVPAGPTATAPAAAAAAAPTAAAPAVDAASADAAVPVPEQSPLSQPVAAQEEKPKRRGIFGLFPGS